MDLTNAQESGSRKPRKNRERRGAFSWLLRTFRNPRGPDFLVSRLLSAVCRLCQFAIHPLQVILAALHDRDGQDLRHIVRVGLPDRLLECLVQVLPAFHDAQPFFGGLDLALPPIGAGDGADDLGAGGQRLAMTALTIVCALAFVAVAVLTWMICVIWASFLELPSLKTVLRGRMPYNSSLRLSRRGRFRSRCGLSCAPSKLEEPILTGN